MTFQGVYKGINHLLSWESTQSRTTGQVGADRFGHTPAMSKQSRNVLADAIDYVEANLDQSLTLAGIADKVHLSAYHFARLFRAATGDSLMNYVRGRRLSEAVRLLGEGTDSVLDIALACGFTSHEGFTRAFRKEFGISPITYRKNAHQFRVPTKRRLSMSNAPVAVSRTPEFKKVDTILAIGCAGEFKPGATQEIGGLWQRFVPRMAEITNVIGPETYGICCLPEEGERDPEHFTYVAALAVTDLDHIPDGMTGVTLPAHEYAVFAYDGGIGPELPKAVRYIFGEWLPQSGYELDGPDFEYYDDQFDPQSDTGRFFIYLPVKRKA